MDTITATTQLETIECCRCGMTLALSKRWIQHARDIGDFKQQFWCPYCGNQQGWGTSQHEKKLNQLRRLRKQAEEEATRQKKKASDALAEADHFRRSRDGMKGQLTKVKNRVKAGVCPCCNRTFKQLAAHMKRQHPDYVG